MQLNLIDLLSIDKKDITPLKNFEQLELPWDL